jgi:hypothetical protein
MGRKILYGLIGAFAGCILLTIPLALLDVQNGLVALVTAVCGALLGIYTGVTFAAKMNTRNTELVSEAPTTNRSNNYVAGSIVGVEFLVSMIAYVVAVLALSGIYTFRGMVDAVTQPTAGVVVGSWVIIIVSSWLGVRYVVRKNILRPEHDPMKIMPQVLLMNFVIYFSSSNPAGILGSLLSTVVIYLLLRRFKNNPYTRK